MVVVGWRVGSGSYTTIGIGGSMLGGRHGGGCGGWVGLVRVRGGMAGGCVVTPSGLDRYRSLRIFFDELSEASL